MERQPTLLLVEDEHVLRTLVAEFLERAGYDVRQAASGPEAVETYRASGPFDVVMADLNLPGYSGAEVCRRIRRIDPEQPILVASAAVLPEHRLVLDAIGAVEFLSKPYHPETLLNRLDGLRTSRAGTATGAPYEAGLAVAPGRMLVSRAAVE